MSYTTLIDPADLAAHLDDPDWIVIDCRFSLDQTERGRRDYRAAHIPGAQYAHLDEDLSGPIVPGATGRHPLPPVEAAARTFGGWGIHDGAQVVVYDDAGGMIAGRLWWMLRWLGHAHVALLDGGWQRWQREGHPTRAGNETRPAATFTPRPRPELVVDVQELERRRHETDTRIVDSRSPERYRGEHEPIDPVAGHIPGAICGPLGDNLGPDGRFLPPDALATRFRTLVGDTPSEQVIFYCGSGVSAAQNLLAFAHAGLGDAQLYAGSWSEWITDPERPIERG